MSEWKAMEDGHPSPRSVQLLMCTAFVSPIVDLKEFLAIVVLTHCDSGIHERIAICWSSFDLAGREL